MCIRDRSNPATALNLAAGKQAIDSNGEIITGTAEVCDMLANLGTATAADVTSGKTFTSVSGVNVVGTLSVKAPAVKRIAIINDGISNNISICLLYTSSLDITVSGTLRAKSKQLVGYRPLQIEQTVIYDEHELLTGSGEWDVPEGVSEVRIVLISGGQAGYNGQSGEKGTAGGNIVRRDNDYQTTNVQAGQSGSRCV